MEEAAWGDEDELDIDVEEFSNENKNAEETKDTFDEASSEIFVPPSAGAHPLTTAIKKNPFNVGINVAAGNFIKGLELLQKSIAMTNFEPLKQLFVDTYTLSKVKVQALPHGPAFDFGLKSSGSLPLLPVNMRTIEEKIEQGIELTTKADFQGALKAFRTCL